MAAAKNKIAPELLNQITNLAQAGLSKTDVAKNLKFARTVLHRNTAANAAYESGKARLRSKIATEVLKRATDSKKPSDKILVFMAEKLGVFSTDFQIAPPKDTKDAAKYLGLILHALMSGDLPTDKALAASKIAAEFSRASDLSDLQKQIEDLREQLDVKPLGVE